MSVAGVVVREEDGKALVIRHAGNGAWEPPGGVLERDETVEDGVRREVYAETGATVRVERLTGAYKNMARGVVALVFRFRPEAGRARPADEAAEVRWLDPEQVASAMAEAYAVRVIDALGNDPAPGVWAHDGRRLTATARKLVGPHE